MNWKKGDKLTYSILSSESVVTVNVVGAVTASDAETMERCFREIMESTEETVTIDFSEVPLVTSQYIGEFISLYRRLRDEKRELVFSKVGPDLRSLFEAICLDRLVSMTG